MRILVLFLFFAASVFAQEELNFWERRDLARILGTISVKPETVTANFTIYKFSDTDTLSQDGLLLYKAPDKLKCEITDDPRSQWAIDGNILTTEKDLKQTNYDLQKSSAIYPSINLLMDIINGEYLDEDRYELQYASDNLSHIFGIKPKEGSYKDTILYLYFDKGIATLSNIKMFENGKNVLTIELIAPFYNTPIHDSTFRL